MLQSKKDNFSGDLEANNPLIQEALKKKNYGDP